jgi:uncharacterized membrane protein YkgB
MNQSPMIKKIDQTIISTAHDYTDRIARLALIVVFFWFGILKVLELSPAQPLVTALLVKTLPFWGSDSFMFWFGWFEMLIGICFLFPKTNRLLIPIFGLHMLMTSLPLFILPTLTWSAFLVPTMEGQYIIKNLVLVALVVALISRMKPYAKN